MPDSAANLGSPTGTIDITSLVGVMKSTFVKWGVALIVNAASSTPYTAWLKWPVISNLFEFFVTKIIQCIADALEMEAFFLNTAIRKASQAQDYVDAVGALKALPPTATDKEYEDAEQKEMLAFRNFVMVTN